MKIFKNYLINRNKMKFSGFKSSRCKKNPEYGGAAMEYILVTTFATVVGIAALGFIGGVIKEKLNDMADQLGVEAEEFEIDVFSSSQE